MRSRATEDPPPNTRLAPPSAPLNPVCPVQPCRPSKGPCLSIRQHLVRGVIFRLLWHAGPIIETASFIPDGRRICSLAISLVDMAPAGDRGMRPSNLNSPVPRDLLKKTCLSHVSPICQFLCLQLPSRPVLIDTPRLLLCLVDTGAATVQTRHF